MLSRTTTTTTAEPEIPELMLRDILPSGGRSSKDRHPNLMETLMEGKMILGDTMKNEGTCS